MKKLLLSALTLTFMAASANAVVVNTLPWTHTFDSDPLYNDNDFSYLEGSRDGVYWMYEDGWNCIAVRYHDTKPLDDWLFTPKIYLKRDVQYTVTISLRAGSEDFNEKFEMKIGKATASPATIAMMTTELLPVTDVNHILWRNYSATFTAPSTNYFYLGVHACSVKNQYALNVRKFSVYETATPLDLSADETTEDGPRVFTQSFAKVGCMTGWSVIDGNHDGVKWHFEDKGAQVQWCESSTLAQDDWLISPELPLTPGHRYRMLAEAANYNSSLPNKLEVKLGDAATAAAMTLPVLPVTTLPGRGNYPLEAVFDVSGEGPWRIGFHGISDPDHFMTELRNLRLLDLGQTPGSSTGIEDIASEPATLTGPVTVYDVCGRVVATAASIDQLQLPGHGIFVVRSAHRTVKILR